MDFCKFIDAELKGNKKATYFQETTTRIMYPTGNLGHDYKNGIFNRIYNDDDEVTSVQHSIGNAGGSVITIIGKSGVGKTTKAIKDAIGCIRPYLQNSLIPHYLEPSEQPRTLLHIADVEKTIDMNDIRRITQLPIRILKNAVRIDPVNNDKELMSVLEFHRKWKETNLSMIRHRSKDIFGNTLVDYPPTVLIIDAMTKLNIFESTSTEFYDNITSNTAGARKAKNIGDMLSLIVDIAKRYNIIIFNICHINQRPNMSFLPQPKQYKGLKQDETISGGEKQIFLSTNIIRYDHEKNIDIVRASDINFGEDIKGALVRENIIKTKTNAFGGTTPSIFLSHKGVDNLCSNLYLAKEMDLLGSKGNKFYVPGHDGIQFTFKNYTEVFQNNPALLSELYRVLSKGLTPCLSSYEDAAKANSKFEKAVLEDTSDYLDANGKLVVSEETMKEMQDIHAALYKAIN